MVGDRLVCTFEKAGTTFDYYHPDHLHSTAVLSDTSGNLTQHYEYSAFGQDRYTYSSTAFPVSKRYTSQVLDEDTGLYFYGARYYAPELGRFIQPDTIIPTVFNPQGFNRYSYALNNPLRFTDPTGHQEAEPEPAPRMGVITAEIVNGLRDARAQIALQSRVQLENQVRFANSLVRNGPVRLTTPGQPELWPVEPGELPSAPRPAPRSNPAARSAPTGTTSENAPSAQLELNLSGRPGKLGSLEVREHISEIADKLKQHDWDITGGGGETREEYIRGAGGGRKGSAYPDITAQKNGQTLRVNTIDTRANGVTPTTREADNAARIRNLRPNDKLILIPKPSE